MLCTFFSPSPLDPVLERGTRQKEAVVTPEVSTGFAGRQPIFGDKTDGTLLDPACVQAVGQSQVGDVTCEATAAVEAAMAGEKDNQINGAVGPSIPKVMEGTGAYGIAT